MTEVADYEYEEVVVEDEDYEYEEVEVTENDDAQQNSANMLGNSTNIDYGYGDDVDYGYGDNVDYGYGDNANDAVDYGYGDNPQNEPDYGYGDAATPASPPPAPTGKKKSGRRASIGAGDDPAPVSPTKSEASKAKRTGPASPTKSPTKTTKKKKGAIGGAGLASLMQNNNDGQMASPKEKRKNRGRRLSMFAFAGQDDDQVGQYAGAPGGVGSGSGDKSVSSQQSSTSKRSTASKRGGKKMSNLHNQHNYGSIMKTSSDHGPPSDDDMLSSFIKGQGMPGGGIMGSGGEGKKKGNRRLSMMAFAGAGGVEGGVNMDEVVPEEEKLDPAYDQAQQVQLAKPGIAKRGHTTGGGSRRAKPQSQQGAKKGAPARGLTRANSSDHLDARAAAAGPSNRGGVNAVPGFASPRRTGRRASIGGANPTMTQEKSFLTPAQQASATRKANLIKQQSHSQVMDSKSVGDTKKPASMKKRTKSVPMKNLQKFSQQMQSSNSAAQSQQETTTAKAANNRHLSASVHVDERKNFNQKLNQAVGQQSTQNAQQVRAQHQPDHNKFVQTQKQLNNAMLESNSNHSKQEMQQRHQLGHNKFVQTQKQLNTALSKSEHTGVGRNPSGYSKASSKSGKKVSMAEGGPTELTKPSQAGVSPKAESSAVSSASKKPSGILRGKASENGAGSYEEELNQYMQSSGEAAGTTATTEASTNIASRQGKIPTPVSAVSSGASSASSAASSVSAKESAAAAVAAGVPSTNNMSLLYFLARCCDWDGVMDEVQVNHRDAKVVSEKDGTTALHLAVMSRTNPMMRDGMAGEPAPLNVIEELVKAVPEACIIRCTKKRYTPLHYACLVADANYDMEDCCQIVEILLKHSPHSPFVFTDDGFSALDVHILSYSQLHKHKEEVYSGARTSTVVVRTLLAGEPSLADARVYRNKIRGPLELLYRCNIDEFKEAAEFEELAALEGDDDAKRKERMEKFGSVASILSDWWAWKWSLLLLKFASISAGQEVVPFNAVQAAARLVGCPLPILALAVTTLPEQVTQRDPTGDIYNLPLHEVCSWRADMENVAGDPFIATRKFKAMRLLLEQYPEAARMTNNCGETPLQLAVETCTPWHGGLETLVEACPKALKFPRKLRITDNGLSLAVQHHSAIDSVGTVDSDEGDPLEDIENMYPFLVSSVLGGVSKNKRRPPISYNTEELRTEHYQNLERKSLQAIRAVYGLLRARPEVMEKYRKLVTSESKKSKKKK